MENARKDRGRDNLRQETGEGEGRREGRGERRKEEEGKRREYERKS
jgi:hypothetical protein